MNDVEHICKLSWDLSTIPLTITGITTIINQLGNSDGDVVALKNVSKDDLSLIKDALAFYSIIHYQLEEMKKSIDASQGLMVQMMNEVKEFSEKEKKFLEDVVMSIDISRGRNGDGLDKRFRRKV